MDGSRIILAAHRGDKFNFPDNIENYKIAIDYGCKMFTSNNIAEANLILSELKVK